MATLSVLGAAGQYGCYAYDDALTLKFGSDQNGTTRNVVPFQVEVLVNIIRFTSLMHIYYMMFLLFLFAVVVFFTIVHSQRAFNSKLRFPPIPIATDLSMYRIKTALIYVLFCANELDCSSCWALYLLTYI